MKTRPLPIYLLFIFSGLMALLLWIGPAMADAVQPVAFRQYKTAEAIVDTGPDDCEGEVHSLAKWPEPGLLVTEEESCPTFMLKR